MRSIAFLFVFVFANSLLLHAQTDTAFQYFDKDWKNCRQDTAVFYAKIYKRGNLWDRKDFWVKGNILQMEGSYLKKDCKTQQGLFTWFNEKGIKTTTKEFEKGNTNNITIYYPDGKKRAVVLYEKERQTVARGWDESGDEIPDFIFEKEAKFPGGLSGWRTYLEQNLRADVAAVANAPIGVYRVKVQFIVNKEGLIDQVKAITVPEKCLPCGVEAVRVISEGPTWEPAVQYNRPVTYQAIQYISFQVAKE